MKSALCRDAGRLCLASRKIISVAAKNQAHHFSRIGKSRDTTRCYPCNPFLRTDRIVALLPAPFLSHVAILREELSIFFGGAPAKKSHSRTSLSLVSDVCNQLVGVITSFYLFFLFEESLATCYFRSSVLAREGTPESSRFKMAS